MSLRVWVERFIAIENSFYSNRVSVHKYNGCKLIWRSGHVNLVCTADFVDLLPVTLLLVTMLNGGYWQFCLGTDEKVSGELKKNLMQARLDKKYTQAQLAQVCLAQTCFHSKCFKTFSLHCGTRVVSYWYQWVIYYSQYQFRVYTAFALSDPHYAESYYWRFISLLDSLR